MNGAALPTAQVDESRRGTSDTKVLYVAMDGMRWDKMAEAGTPNLDALGARGQFGPSFIQDSALAGTNSGPGHANIFTGVWPDKHNVLDNSFNGYRKAKYPDFITRAKQLKPDLFTFSTLDWIPLNQFLVDAPDVKMQQTGTDEESTDRQSTDAALEALTRHTPDLMFVYLHDADATGHTCSSETPEYLAAIRRVDAKFGELVRAVRDHENSNPDEAWLIVAATDHGQYADGHGGDEYTCWQGWILASGPGIPAQHAVAQHWRQVDVMPTIYRHLGLPVDPSWDLDGVPIGTRTDDAFDAVSMSNGIADGTSEPAATAGWTTDLPKNWTRLDKTPEAAGAGEFRGWRLMTLPFWVSCSPGRGRGSFVRSRGIVAVADPDQWNDVGDPAASGLRFDSALSTPWVSIGPGQELLVDYVGHYKQLANGQPQKAEVVAEFDNGVRLVLWSADAASGARFDISRAAHFTAATPHGARRARVTWRLFEAGDNGYWAIDCPHVSVR